ncbi:hypothetical protein ACH35V_26160 [Actinomadura sp. 1N219]|uniref:hypothetical protein n=1 Tax=Actinomadura sp. 1N219 TaxID=3375152 RepID=UPI0037A88BBD
MSAPRGHRAETYTDRAETYISRAETGISRAETSISWAETHMGKGFLAGAPDVDDHPEGEHFPARPFATVRASGQWTGMGRTA